MSFVCGGFEPYQKSAICMWSCCGALKQQVSRAFGASRIKLPDEPTSELVGYCRLSLRDNHINDLQYLSGPVAAL